MPDLKKKVLDSSSLISAVRNALWLLGGAVATVIWVRAKGTSFGVLAAGAVALAAAVTIATLLVRRRLRGLRSEIAVKSEELGLLQNEVGILTERAKELTDTPFGYRVKSVKYIYKIDASDPSQHSQDCATEIEATRNDVSLFEARYTWSGAGESVLALQTARQILLSDPGMRYQGHDYYYVHLVRPLMIGEREQIRVKQSLADPERRMDFQLTKTVREPIESLVLSVIFPPGGPGKNDIRAMARRSARDDTDIIEMLAFDYEDGLNRASVKIDNPERGITYALEWTWDEYRLNGLNVRQRRSEEVSRVHGKEGGHVQ